MGNEEDESDSDEVVAQNTKKRTARRKETKRRSEDAERELQERKRVYLAGRQSGIQLRPFMNRRALQESLPVSDPSIRTSTAPKPSPALAMASNPDYELVENAENAVHEDFNLFGVIKSVGRPRFNRTAAGRSCGCF